MRLENRKFLFLQGPHGPYFSELANLLEENGAKTIRIAFNSGDAHYWKHEIARFNLEVENWPQYLAGFLDEHNITDLVLYGESRPIHKTACDIARTNAVMTHIFEEGYLRPYWVTYERDGVNGNSRLMDFSMDDVRRERAAHPVNLEPAPAVWGNAWHHNWYGFAYHFQLWLGRKRFPQYVPHRKINLFTEWRLNAWRLMIWPFRIGERDWKTWLFLRKKPRYYVAILQLEHDASLEYHSDYDSQKDFIHEVIEAFAHAANNDAQLVFKLHPFEDGRAPLHKWIKSYARQYGVKDRVKLFFGGKLGPLLDHTLGGITVNSTAAQQVLWRNLPLKIMGRSVFSKSEFSFDGSLDEYFASQKKPDHEAFLEYRSFLLETSQIPGGFYAKSSREELIDHILPVIASSTHPYDKSD